MTAQLDRAERRRLHREDAQWIGKPLVLNRGRRPFEANVRHTVSILKESGSGRASAAAAEAHALFERTIKSLKPPKVACAKGCHYCCHTFVTVLPPEAFRVARLLREHGPVDPWIAATNEKTKSIAQTERWKAKIPCPLLENDICSIHPMRPLACRGCVSSSAEACYRIYMEGTPESPPFPLDYNSLSTATAAVLAAALMIVGLPHNTLDWNGALAAAVSAPDTEERWLAGEDIFDGVTAGIGADPGTPFHNLVRELAANVRPTI